MRSQCGRCFKDEPSLQIMQSIQRSRLREKVCIGTHGRRPRILKARMLHPTQNVNSPALHSAVLIAKALERNSYFDFVPAFDEPSLGFEEVVGIEVYASLERINVSKSAARC